MVDATFIIDPSGIWASRGVVARYVPVIPTYHLRVGPKYCFFDSRLFVALGFIVTLLLQNLQDAETLAQDIIMGEVCNLFNI